MSGRDVMPVSEAQIAVAAGLSLFDARGNRIRFGALFELEKTVVVFIRHFFCVSCQKYVSNLTAVRPDALERAGTKIVIVGCGDWLLVKNYCRLTCGKPHPLISYYADPNRNIYRALGISTQSTHNNKRRGRCILMNTVRSVMSFLRNPLHIGRQGSSSQLGGAFIVGPNNKCSFAHYMQHAEDHINVPELIRKAGVRIAYPQA
ncbi:hypothetical protein JB92DRAFT_2789107 [Gautieria morchelliformis]|nr:hypothetical protein JB92DRAFT_2789107 [Gautieria morchelliformis]